MGPRVKKTFLQLIKVSALGLKVAQSRLLSTLTPSQLAHAIADNDATALAKAPGLGKKGAQKIILELKGSIDLSQIALPLRRQHPSLRWIRTGTSFRRGLRLALAGVTGFGCCRGLRRKRYSHAACHRRDVPRVLAFTALMDRPPDERDNDYGTLQHWCQRVAAHGLASQPIGNEPVGDVRPMFSKALSDSHGSRPSCNCSWTRLQREMCHDHIACLLADPPGRAKPRWP